MKASVCFVEIDMCVADLLDNSLEMSVSLFERIAYPVEPSAAAQPQSLVATGACA